MLQNLDHQKKKKNVKLNAKHKKEEIVISIKKIKI